MKFSDTVCEFQVKLCIIPFRGDLYQIKAALPLLTRGSQSKPNREPKSDSVLHSIRGNIMNRKCNKLRKFPGNTALHSFKNARVYFVDSTKFSGFGKSSGNTSLRSEIGTIHKSSHLPASLNVKANASFLFNRLFTTCRIGISIQLLSPTVF